MNVYNLKYLYQKQDPQGHFFDRDTLRYFGDTMRNFGVVDGGTIKALINGRIEEVAVWKLYRKKPVKNGLYGHCVFFRKDTYQIVFNHA